MGYNDAVINALVSHAERAAPGEPETFIATALIESGLDPRAQGDGGNSFGLFQLNRNGRLATAGLTPEQAYDPATNARVSADEFRTYYDRGARGSELALRAQRPSDPNYGNKFNNAMAEARKIWNQYGGGKKKGKGKVPKAPGAKDELTGKQAQSIQDAGRLTPRSSKLLQQYLASTEADVLAGRMPADPFNLLGKLERIPVPPPANGGLIDIDTGGDDHGDGGGGGSHALKPGKLAETISGTIGGPGQGTHSFTEGPNNWQSDNAVDLSHPVGTPLYAVFDGEISPRFGSLGSSGRFAGLRMSIVGSGNEAYYAHLSKFAPGIKPGARVKKGQLIGYSGSANGVTHTHFGIENGNPMDLLK